jgi:hypothetical protein
MFLLLMRKGNETGGTLFWAEGARRFGPMVPDIMRAFIGIFQPFGDA